MKNRLIATLVTGALAATMASAAFGQADPKNSAYWLEQYGTPDANIWRSGTGLCWRAGYITWALTGHVAVGDGCVLSQVLRTLIVRCWKSASFCVCCKLVTRCRTRRRPALI